MRPQSYFVTCRGLLYTSTFRNPTNLQSIVAIIDGSPEMLEIQITPLEPRDVVPGVNVRLRQPISTAPYNPLQTLHILFMYCKQRCR
jgi:hypothetical protein